MLQEHKHAEILALNLFTGREGDGMPCSGEAALPLLHALGLGSSLSLLIAGQKRGGTCAILSLQPCVLHPLVLSG